MSLGIRLPPDAPVRTTVAMVERIADMGDAPVLTATSITGSVVTLSGASLAHAVARTAGVLQERGIGPGSIAAIFLDNRAGLEATVVHWAIHWAGGVTVPLNTRLSDREVETILTHAEAHIVCSAGPLAGRITDLCGALGTSMWDLSAGILSVVEAASPCPPATCTEDDIADILYTSGTTGTPKGVELTHGNCISCGLELQEAMRLGAGDVLMSAVPYFTSTGAHTNPLAAFVTPCHYVLEPEFDQHAFVPRVEQYGVTVYMGVPSMLQLIMRDTAVPVGLPPSLRRLVFGGSVTTADSLRNLAAAFPGRELVNLYGLTEGGPGGACIGPEDILAVPGSVGCHGNGRNTFLMVQREDGTEADPDEVGEICVRSPAVMRGYRNNPDATAQALRGGWLHTSDYGYRDEQGYLWYVGRRDDLIVRGGFNIATGEVESVLAGCPGVGECAVVGVAHDVLGQDLVAYVVPEGDDIDATAVSAFLRERLADYKVPRRVVLLDELPRSAMGKILKRALPPVEGRVIRLDPAST